MSHIRNREEIEGYRIERELGSGGFGVTYLVVDEELGKRFALKEYFPVDFAERAEDGVTARAKDGHAEDFAWGRERFVDEARVLARFRHPNIVDVARIFSANGTAYIVEGYQSGRSLKAWLQGLDAPPTQDELDLLVAPLLDALETMHANDVLHRDIAPDNIYIRDDGSPVLLDFGSAREAVAQRSHSVSSVVKSGYSPPEQYSTRGKGQGAWSDIYALAATLYRAVTGEAPDESTERVLVDELEPASRAAKGAYRARFLDALDWGLRIAPSDRPQSAAQWRPALLGDGVVPEARAPEGDGARSTTTPGAGRTTSQRPATTQSQPRMALSSRPPPPSDDPPRRGGAGMALGLTALALTTTLGAGAVALLQGPWKWKLAENAALCAQALDAARMGWSADGVATGEASGRGLSVDGCRVALALPTISQVAQIDKAKREKDEAERRLRDAMRSSEQAKAEMQRTTRELEQARLEGAGGEAAGLTPNELCRKALNLPLTDWDLTEKYAAFSRAAIERGFTITTCRSAMGVSSQPAAPDAPAPDVPARSFPVRAVCNPNSTYSNVRNGPGAKDTVIVDRLENSDEVSVIGEALSPTNNHRYAQISYEKNGRTRTAYIDVDALSSSCSLGPDAPRSGYWAHGGSKMRLVASGDSRTFVYIAPRKGLADLGIQDGTVLFEGRLRGSRLDGVSYSFNRGCAPVAFAVRGEMSSLSTSVTLNGDTPRVNAACAVKGRASTSLVFDYVSN